MLELLECWKQHIDKPTRTVEQKKRDNKKQNKHKRKNGGNFMYTSKKITNKECIKMSTSIKHYITDEDVININDLVSELAVILRKFEIDLNPYQTDVYFYYDADAKIGRLETFINVGGHSWLNDDHVTIYSDSPNYDDVYDYFNDISEFADALEISENDLIKAVRQFKDFGINFPVDRRNIIDYIKSDDKLANKVTAYYIDYYVDEYEAEFLSKAQEILSRIEIEPF